jgi:hypothetical protein
MMQNPGAGQNMMPPQNTGYTQQHRKHTCTGSAVSEFTCTDADADTSATCTADISAGTAVSATDSCTAGHNKVLHLFRKTVSSLL